VFNNKSYISNCADPDQTATKEVVISGSSLFIIKHPLSIRRAIKTATERLVGEIERQSIKTNYSPPPGL